MSINLLSNEIKLGEPMTENISNLFLNCREVSDLKFNKIICNYSFSNNNNKYCMLSIINNKFSINNAYTGTEIISTTFNNEVIDIIRQSIGIYNYFIQTSWSPNNSKIAVNIHGLINLRGLLIIFDVNTLNINYYVEYEEYNLSNIVWKNENVLSIYNELNLRGIIINLNNKISTNFDMYLHMSDDYPKKSMLLFMNNSIKIIPYKGGNNNEIMLSKLC